MGSAASRPHNNSMRYLKDLLFTDRFLIKGHAHTGGQRLSSFLNGARKRFLEMEESTVVQHSGGVRTQAEWMMVRVDDILFAYEMEQTGDEALRKLASRDKPEIPVVFHLKCSPPVQLSGLVRKRAIRSDMLPAHDFIVMVNPEIRGLPAESSPEHALLESAPYLIVNRDRISFIFR